MLWERIRSRGCLSPVAPYEAAMMLQRGFASLHNPDQPQCTRHNPGTAPPHVSSHTARHISIQCLPRISLLSINLTSPPPPLSVAACPTGRPRHIHCRCLSVRTDARHPACRPAPPSKIQTCDDPLRDAYWAVTAGLATRHVQLSAGLSRDDWSHAQQLGAYRTCRTGSS